MAIALICSDLLGIEFDTEDLLLIGESFFAWGLSESFKPSDNGIRSARFSKSIANVAIVIVNRLLGGMLSPEILATITQLLVGGIMFDTVNKMNRLDRHKEKERKKNEKMERNNP